MVLVNKRYPMSSSVAPTKPLPCQGPRPKPPRGLGGDGWPKRQPHPVTLSPVCCELPRILDDDVSRIGEIATAMRMVIPVNILGLPSCAVPVGCDDGLPHCVQLIGDRFRADRLLDAAEAIERRHQFSRPSSRGWPLPSEWSDHTDCGPLTR